MKPRITIIGAGNLGTAIAEGILHSNFTKAERIIVTKRNVFKRPSALPEQVVCTDNNIQAVNDADIVILAVKPFQLSEVLQEIKTALKESQILLSVVTGVSLEDINSIISKKITIFRAMPNTAIAIKESMTCISYSNASEKSIETVEALFSSLGKVAFIEDDLMDAATVLGACGTAFALRFIRASIQGGIEIGFDAQTASLIAAQTVKGAADLLLKNQTHPEQEIDKVTTPKGCTIAGLNEMEHQGFSSSLIRGIATSYRKIKEN